MKAPVDLGRLAFGGQARVGNVAEERPGRDPAPRLVPERVCQVLADQSLGD
jgi:hypothetical protein